MKALAGVAAVLSIAIGGTAAPAAGARRPPAVKPTQEVVTLLTPHRAFSLLRNRRSRGRTIAASRPITGGRTVLPVIGRATRDGARWLRVMLPGRPNGRKGWIAQRRTRLATTVWHVVVRTSTRHVLVYRHGRRVRTFGAVVGKPATPTPRGQFFVEESVLMPPDRAGAPFALALSARSNVLQEFDGGPGQVAIHGVGNLGGRPGTAVSHGCVRLADGAIRYLAARIAPGVPVTIRR